MLSVLLLQVESEINGEKIVFSSFTFIFIVASVLVNWFPCPVKAPVKRFCL